MSKSNVYSALIEEKISRSKNLFINSSQELKQTTVIMAGSNVVTSLNLSCESLDDEVDFNEDIKNQFIEWHKIALHIFFSKFLILGLKRRKPIWKPYEILWNFLQILSLKILSHLLILNLKIEPCSVGQQSWPHRNYRRFDSQ